MDERGQFTFYRSFWEAVRDLPKKDRLPIYEAVIAYALDGTEPAGLSKAQAGYFLLMKPNLDSARKKAASGKQGGSKPKGNGKQKESKPQAPGKQIQMEKEGEKEIEKENETEGEKEKEQTESAHFDGRPFTRFWEAYPKKIDREAAWAAWKTLNPAPETTRAILSALEAWKLSGQWTEDGGRFIPDAANFLAKGYWRSVPPPAKKDAAPKGASGELGAAELEAIQRAMREGDYAD